MRYDNIRAFEKHLEGAKPNHFSPLYSIIGKESYDCNEAIQLLQQFLIPTNQRDFALKVWDGNSLNEKDFVMDLYSQSFFSEKRVILINHVEKLKKSTQEELEKYIKKGSRFQHLILNASSLTRQTNFYKLLEKEGIILEFAELKSWDKEKRLIEWVGKKVAQLRKIMSYPVCQQFVKAVGVDHYVLANELEKLLCFIGDQKEITWKDIEEICTVNPVESIWQLGETIFSRSPSAALKIMKSLLNEGQPFLQLLRQIRSQISIGFQVCTALALNKTSAEITQEFPYMKGHILEKNIANARQYGIIAFQHALLEIDAVETEAKNTQTSEQLLAELLIIKLTCHHGTNTI